MMKPWQIALLGVAVAISLLVWKREPLIVAWFAARTETTTLDERIALIEDDVKIRLPEEGEGPFPVVLQFHGCAGIRPPFHEQWAQIANRAGFAAMIVDSNGPRGYSRQEALETICDGKALFGHERAGDIVAALEIAKADNRLDTERLVLAGWSHGAWSLMDFLTMDGENRVPAGLSGWIENPIDIDGAILFYPYCGAGALSRFRNWAQTPETTLAFIAGTDQVVNAEECLSYFHKREARDPSLDLIVYEDANHVFDDPFLEPEWIHWYNEDYFQDAAERYERLLNSIK